jgi:hypothetical protein
MNAAIGRLYIDQTSASTGLRAMYLSQIEAIVSGQPANDSDAMQHALDLREQALEAEEAA